MYTSNHNNYIPTCSPLSPSSHAGAYSTCPRVTVWLLHPWLCHVHVHSPQEQPRPLREADWGSIRRYVRVQSHLCVSLVCVCVLPQAICAGVLGTGPSSRDSKPSHRWASTVTPHTDTIPPTYWPHTHNAPHRLAAVAVLPNAVWMSKALMELRRSKVLLSSLMLPSFDLLTPPRNPPFPQHSGRSLSSHWLSRGRGCHGIDLWPWTSCWCWEQSSLRASWSLETQR